MSLEHELEKIIRRVIREEFASLQRPSQGDERPSQLLTVKEAALRLGITESALRFKLHAGRAPKSALVAGRRMFRVSDLDNYLTEAFDEDEEKTR